MESKISFEIRKFESSERIISIDAGSFKAAIKEFSECYDIKENDKYSAIYDGNKIDFRFVFSTSSMAKYSLGVDEDDHFEIYTKKGKVYVVLSNSEGKMIMNENEDKNSLYSSEEEKRIDEMYAAANAVSVGLHPDILKLLKDRAEQKGQGVIAYIRSVLVEHVINKDTVK